MICWPATKPSVDRLSTAATSLIRDGGAVHVSVWSQDGTLLWSDIAALEGHEIEPNDEVRTHAVQFDAEERSLLTSQGTQVELRTLLGDDAGSLAMVDFGSKTPTGQPVVVEMFYPADLLGDLAAQERDRFRPLLLLGLGLLIVAQLPLTIALSHRRQGAGQPTRRPRSPVRHDQRQRTPADRGRGPRWARPGPDRHRDGSVGCNRDGPVSAQRRPSRSGRRGAVDGAKPSLSAQQHLPGRRPRRGLGARPRSDGRRAARTRRRRRSRCAGDPARADQRTVDAASRSRSVAQRVGPLRCVTCRHQARPAPVPPSHSTSSTTVSDSTTRSPAASGTPVTSVCNCCTTSPRTQEPRW